MKPAKTISEVVPETSKKVVYFTIGDPPSNLMRKEGGNLAYLNTENVWEYSGGLIGYFTGGNLTAEPISLEEAKAFFAKLAPGKKWVP